MNALDYAVLLISILSIAAYGIWRTRGKRSLETYIQGSGKSSWLIIGISVMATQASAITFLSTPGQGFESGLGFVQNYFGAPFALMIIAAIFLPLFRRLNVYTAYEFLGKRFDAKTRLLGAGLFLLQRGLGAGITIYAPAIVLSTVFGWPLDLTIISSGLVVIIYTVVGGSEAVSLTQKYQFAVIFAGMIAAFVVLIWKLPAGIGFRGAMNVAGGLNRLNAVDFSPSIQSRYTFWSGTIGGLFLALSYFGTDQSQVQRYLSSGSLRESRLGLMFNAVFKIPMQFGILLLGAMLFSFYQFEKPPVYFNQAAWSERMAADGSAAYQQLESDFAAVHAQKREAIQRWIAAERDGNADGAAAARERAQELQQRSEEIRARAKAAVGGELKSGDEGKGGKPVSDADYVFITFILGYLPHGLIGLLVAAFFAATLSSKSAELNALASTSTIDVYRNLVSRGASDAHYVMASRVLTVFWGMVAIGFALFARLAENLIQALNIVGSIFYGPVLTLFLVAFFLKWIGGTAVFWAAIGAQLLVIALYFTLDISYLWYNFIGPGACILLAIVLQTVLPRQPKNVGANAA
ncbi:MAG: sodium:solute symporter [Phycisphaeraceae bacterium]|nr:sodium:solute symporter [Phycisphaeraceae bacterium]